VGKDRVGNSQTGGSLDKVCGIIAIIYLVYGSLTAYIFTLALIACKPILTYFSLRPRKDILPQ
jgi:hypothetical protein